MGATGSIEFTVGEPMQGTKWVVLGTLGQGGMGLVLDVVKARLIHGAMKVLLPSFSAIPEFAAKFLDEVQVTARLQHPNLVQVLDFDRLQDGTPFMVMERLRGRTLRSALRETLQSSRSWTPANAYAVAHQIAQGLYRAHSHSPSIVHRDVKPENVFLHRSEGSLESIVKVMDFGVAAVMGERDRQCIGTPRYMAPEQLAGDPVSPCTDQYALALIVYEMLTGRFPWDVDPRDLPALADAHVHAPPPPPSRFCPWLPPQIDAALLKALAKDPAARHDTVHGLVFELRELQSINPFPPALGDVHSTEPMMGTLADRGAAFLEGPDTFDRMPVLSVHGSSLSIPPPSLSELSAPSVTTSPPRSPPSNPSEPPAPDPAHGPAPAAIGLLTTSRAPTDSETRPEVPQERSSAAPGAIDTPMTGEARRGSAQGLRETSPRPLRRTAFALAGSVAVLAFLFIVRPSGSPRPSTTRETPIETSASLAELPPRDPAIEPAASATLSAAAAEPITVSSLPPATSASRAPRSDARPARPALRNVTPSASAQAPAPPSSKPAAPDDGRDELYVPEAR